MKHLCWFSNFSLISDWFIERPIKSQVSGELSGGKLLRILKTLSSRTESLINYQKYKINIFYKDDRLKMIQEQYYTQLSETKKYTSFETNFIQLPTGIISNFGL